MGLILLMVPAGVYLSLALLPKGRQALAGIAIAFVASQALYWINVPEGAEDGGLAVLIRLSQIAMVMAAIVQAVRTFLPPDAPRLAWPAVIGAGFLGGAAMVLGGF